MIWTRHYVIIVVDIKSLRVTVQRTALFLLFGMSQVKSRTQRPTCLSTFYYTADLDPVARKRKLNLDYQIIQAHAVSLYWQSYTG